MTPENVVRLQENMGRAGLDAVVAMSPENVIYTTGCHLIIGEMLSERVVICVVPQDGAPTFIFPGPEEEVAREGTWVSDLRTYAVNSHLPVKQDPPMQVLGDVLREKGLEGKKIGIEKSFWPLDFYEALKAQVPEASLVGCEEVFDATRMVKSAEEIEVMSRAAMLTARAIRVAYEMARPGDTEVSIQGRMIYNVVKDGSEPAVFEFSTGENCRQGHRFGSLRRIQEGDVIHADAKGRFSGYWADVSRMAVVGKARAEHVEAYGRLFAIERELIEAVKPGLAVSDLYRRASEAYRRRGLQLTSPFIGHSIGTGHQEKPHLSASASEVLEPGMVLTIEPSCRVGETKLHVEDMVLVTEDGARNLSDYADISEMYVITY